MMFVVCVPPCLPTQPSCDGQGSYGDYQYLHVVGRGKSQLYQAVQALGKPNSRVTTGEHHALRLDCQSTGPSTSHGELTIPSRLASRARFPATCRTSAQGRLRFLPMHDSRRYVRSASAHVAPFSILAHMLACVEGTYGPAPHSPCVSQTCMRESWRRGCW